MMKKSSWLSLLLALALALSCGSGALAAFDADTVTGEAIAAANERTAIFAAHESVGLEFVDVFSGTTVFYETEDYLYILDARERLFDDAGEWQIVTDDDNGRTVRYHWEAVTGSNAGQRHLNDNPVFSIDLLRTEMIESLRDNGDGTLTVTVARKPGSLAETLEESGVADPDVPADAVCCFDVIVDAETLEIQSYEEYGLSADGERMVVGRTAVTYDAAAPEGAEEIRAASAAFRAGAPEEPRTVTIIYDCGTDREERCSLVADRSFEVVPSTYDGYSLFYADPDRLTLFSGGDGVSDVTIYAYAYGAYLYAHDPRLNPRVLTDTVADENAVYGFRPSETGSLAMYADADWSDPAVVAAGRADRIAYHESLRSMYDMLEEMTAAGADIETIARAVSARRNELRLAAYDNDPEGLAAVKARNLEKFGHEEGPLADELFEKYGTWEAVLTSAFNTNAGMDACLGLYDDCYDLYLAAGWLTEERAAPAQRQYAVAAFVDALDPWGEDARAQLGDFSDAGEIDPSFRPEWEQAVESGLVLGFGDGTLRPQQTIRRIEAFMLLSRCLPDLDAAGEPIAFTDVPDWAKADIDRLSAAGLLLGYGDGTLGAEDPLTVEQVRIILERAAA